MRGKERRQQELALILRITPAYAGKSTGEGNTSYFYRDHPCVCGEKLFISQFDTQARGSPLRMRGKVRLLCWQTLTKRITPAYAGKRLLMACGSSLPTDHPCVCGEKHEKHGFSVLFSGSPLRMRGKAPRQRIVN